MHIYIYSIGVGKPCMYAFKILLVQSLTLCCDQTLCVDLGACGRGGSKQVGFEYLQLMKMQGISQYNIYGSIQCK